MVKIGGILSFLGLMVLCPGRMSAVEIERWDSYQLKGTPCSLEIPEGWKSDRHSPPVSPLDRSQGWTLREVYGEEAGLSQIIIPLPDGWLSASYYERGAGGSSGSLAETVKDHAGVPWGDPEGGSWKGLKTITAGWKFKESEPRTPVVELDHFIEDRKGYLQLQLYCAERKFDDYAPLFAHIRKSVGLAKARKKTPR